MKISKKKKEMVRKNILQSAIDLIAKQGYKKSTMSQIARKANVAEATIYNYFPTKEHLLFAYYHELQLATKEQILQTEEFHTFSLKEQIEFLIHTQLTLLAKDREFIQRIYEEMHYHFYYHPGLQDGHDVFLGMIEEMLDIAVEAGEIEPLPFKKGVVHLLGDFVFGVMYYWLNDESEHFSDTTVMIDKSLDVIYAVLRSGLLAKTYNLFEFIIKKHILNHMESGGEFNKRRFEA